MGRAADVRSDDVYATVALPLVFSSPFNTSAPSVQKSWRTFAERQAFGRSKKVHFCLSVLSHVVSAAVERTERGGLSEKVEGR